MPAAPVILNNTPLVALWVLGRFDLLRDPYGEVMIPEAVRAEFLALAKERRLLASVDHAIHELLAAGLYLDADLIAEALRLAGEAD